VVTSVTRDSPHPNPGFEKKPFRSPHRNGLTYFHTFPSPEETEQSNLLTMVHMFPVPAFLHPGGVLGAVLLVTCRQTTLAER